jgi:hypothetical protein
MADKKVAVIVPFYTSDISEYEHIALAQCEKILSSHPIIAIKPKGLDISSITSKYNFTDAISFDDNYFASVQGYNKLMLAEEFYAVFTTYEYILIHQLDAFVFSDELLNWCNRDIDYVGAPWLRINGYTDLFKAVKSRIQRLYHARFNVYVKGMPSDMQFINRVGNGGFSLRRVNKFKELCVTRKAKIDEYLAQGWHYFNEDAFWSIEVNRKRKILNIPGFKTGLKFAFEHAPHKALKLNNNRLPFGCHAWNRNVDFWRPIFSQHGYTI